MSLVSYQDAAIQVTVSDLGNGHFTGSGKIVFPDGRIESLEPNGILFSSQTLAKQTLLEEARALIDRLS